jgi:RecA-family ATPase
VTRALIGGPTGAGKTHLAMAMAGAIITSREFLHWAGPAKPLVVLYIDGEMARDLIQDRMRDMQRRLGGVSLANLHMLCREDFPAMQGLKPQKGASSCSLRLNA